MSRSVAPLAYRSPQAHLRAVILATARRYVKTAYTYPIEMLPWVTGSLGFFLVYRITYSVAGRTEIDGTNAAAYLTIGMLGLGTWTSTIWASGYTLESERSAGTIGALFLAPTSRAAVIAGYGLGSILWLAPSLVGTVVLGMATGARFTVTDPVAVAAAVLTTVAVSLATGFAFAGLFILSRRANMLANFLQAPIYLLAGFIVPRTELPHWLWVLSNAIPAGHAIDALRATTVAGASLAAVAQPLLIALGVALIYGLAGFVSLRKVEHAAKRAGDLDLY